MNTLQSDLQIIFNEIKRYLRHPIHEIKQVPDWEWRRLLTAQFAFTALTGALAGLANVSVHSVIFGFLLMPALTLLVLAISTLFFFYVFQILSDRLISFRKLFTVVFFANIPFFLFQIISGHFPPITLFGLGFSAFLLIVGLVENFELPRATTVRLIAGVYILFFLVYVASRFNDSDLQRSWRNRSEKAPEVQLGE